MNRGEVWWANLPGSGRRPVLVLTRDAAIPLLTRVIAIPATRTVREIPAEVEIGQEDGMPEACALSFDNVLLVSKRQLTDRICALGPERMREVCQAWSDAVDC